ncbi:MAG: type II secretion system protein GspG [Acidobacteria bacterium]|nr:type II secretion system protein GspG [Acidobacteriota bacterium]
MASCKTKDNAEGFSLVELLIVVAIMTTVAAIAVPSYNECINNARIVKAIGDIKKIGSDVSLYQLANNQLPDSLDDLQLENRTDPWGNDYQYLKIAGGKDKGSCRKDKFLNPLNNDFDLYSKGRDGESISPLTAQPSHDDIVRASNGGFIGLAANY